MTAPATGGRPADSGRAVVGTLVSVNVGLPIDVEWQGRTVRTGAWKAPVTGPVMAQAQQKVLRVVPQAELLETTIGIANEIASKSLPVSYAAKEAVNRAFEMSLAEGVRFERRVFHSLFATADQKEGMAAFIAKRPAKFENK